MAYVTVRLSANLALLGDPNMVYFHVHLDYAAKQWYCSSPYFGFSESGSFTVTPDRVGHCKAIRMNHTLSVASLSAMPLNPYEYTETSGGGVSIYEAHTYIENSIHWEWDRHFSLARSSSRLQLPRRDRGPRTQTPR
jgi:hypothetical protein